LKLLRFNGGRLGVLSGDDVVDVTEVVGADPSEFPPMAMVRLVAGFDSHAKELVSAADRGQGAPFDDVTVEAPIPWPSKLIAMPVNYVDHGAEMGSSYTARTRGFFLKAPSSLVGASGAIELPDLPGREIHHEGELAIVIGRQGRRIPRERAFDHIFGYSCLLDMVVRGDEERVMRKSYDTFAPMGPWITTSDEVPDPDELQLRVWVDDELRQDANTRDLVVDVAGMVELCSAVMTLFPGDIIASGTPAGVGPVAPGQNVTVEIERVGRLSLPVRQAAPVRLA
jgi:2-keto-4-pentenoate hydratase/2-oxohepta-3-ene-1,7-dioic acid hydratase in catechol pathway